MGTESQHARTHETVGRPSPRRPYCPANSHYTVCTGTLSGLWLEERVCSMLTVMLICDLDISVGVRVRSRARAGVTISIVARVR